MVETKTTIRKKKFQEVDIPISKTKVELIGDSLEEIKGKTIKLDLTRMLKGKNIELTVKVDIEKGKAVANPIKVKLMPYFIRRMFRKRISYVEDSFETPSQESMLLVKPFLITRNKVSRAVRKTLRNKARNWLEDYISQKNNKEIFDEVLTNKIQKPLSLILKKTYPLSLCELRILEIERPLEPKEIPKKIKKAEEVKEIEKEVIDQLKEIEEEKIEKAKLAIKKTQLKALEKEEEAEKEIEEEVEELKEKEVEELKEKDNIEEIKTKEKKTKKK